jgi:ligand-binding sensor domain-containing protein
MKGIGLLDKKTGQFSRFHPDERFAALDTSRVMHIMNDSQGFKWISTWGNGLFRYNADKNDLKQYVPDPSDSGTIRTADMLSIYEDRSNILWFASLNGMHIGIDKQMVPSLPGKILF